MSFFDTVMLFDVHTMLGILFWSNIFLAAMVFTFETVTKTAQDKEYIRKASVTRLSYAAAFLLMMLKEFLPYSVSVNLGISVLFFSLYLDASILLSFSSGIGNVHRIILKAVLAAGIIIFNILETVFADGTLRSIASTGIILAIFALPTVMFVTQKNNSRFKHAVGGFYILFLMALFPRMIIPMSEIGNAPYENSLTQSAVYLMLIIITVCGTLSTLLFIKEKSDILLEKMATQDQLTQIPNRHSFLHNANLLFLKSQRERREISIMFIDIDYFKKVNDVYGHDFGDTVLKRFAAVLKESVRQHDLICRYGGEEFIVMLQTDESDSAVKLAGRIMERLKFESFEEHSEFKFTVSVGISAGIPNADNSLDSFIKNADAALYEAKNNGRNRVQLYSGVTVND